MNGYRFHLQKYRLGSKTVCPECGRKACFTRYIDEAGEISFPGNVGKCDHINSCGYHYTPKEYFRDNPTVKERLDGHERDGRARSAVRTVPEQEPKISFLPSDWVEQSMRRYDINPLYRYFSKVAGKEDTGRLFRLYRVGTSRMWGGATVFWQIDRNGNVRAGKIMGYNAETGHRVKEPFNQVSWVHSVRKVQDFRMKQCLFGEHLLSDTSSTISSKPVAIVESEKTALVAAHFIPDFIWLATGGMHGCFNSEAMQVLGGREVILFPDLKATEEWRQRLPMLESFCRRATCSDMLERIATGAQREAGLDIADFLLMVDTPQARPSRPSVKLTPLTVPRITKARNGIVKIPASSSLPGKNGMRIRREIPEKRAKYHRKTAVITACSAIFCFGYSPSLRCSTTFR